MAFASTEFIALCQSQIALLTQTLGASSTVVYLAEQGDDGLSLVPLVAYPETEKAWAGLPDSLVTMAQPETQNRAHPDAAYATLPNVDRPDVTQFDGDPPTVTQSSGDRPDVDLDTDPADPADPQPRSTRPVSPVPLADTPPETTDPPPLVRPLVHEGVALGMLVSHRPAPAWSREEQQRADQVANTLALAWILDQRGQWFQQQIQQRQLAQSSQSDTFHDLLHQFRNPLTALQTFGRLLVKRIPDGDPNQPIVEGIVRESRRLQDLAQTFDDALTQGDEDRLAEGGGGDLRRPQFSPTAQGGLLLPEPAAETVRPSAAAALAEGQRWGCPQQRVAGTWVEQITPLLQSAAAIAQERNLHLLEQLPPDLPEVWMDPMALAEVLSNLLDNALKYAPAGATVWVVAGLSQVVAGQTFQGLAVGDTGQGIPLADQPRIFERHFRGVRAKGEIPGTGLGLAIAKELMEAMGGHLDLISPVPQEYQRALSSLIDADPVSQGPGVCFMAWLAQV